MISIVNIASLCSSLFFLFFFFFFQLHPLQIIHSRGSVSSTIGFTPDVSMAHPQLHPSQHGLIQAGIPGLGNQSDALRRSIASQLVAMNGYKEPTPQVLFLPVFFIDVIWFPWTMHCPLWFSLEIRIPLFTLPVNHSYSYMSLMWIHNLIHRPWIFESWNENPWLHLLVSVIIEIEVHHMMSNE